MNTHTSPRANVPLIYPSPRQEKPIREGMGFLAMTAVFWSNILYSELEVVYTAHPGIPLAATDGHRVFFNPDAIIAKKWTVENIAFVHAHEVMHYVRCDLIMAAYWKEVGSVTLGNGRVLPYQHMLMNAACDYVINAGLIAAGIGDFPKGDGLFDPKYSADGMNSSLEVYEKLYDEQQAKGDGGEWGQGHGNFDIHVEPSDHDKHEEQYGNAKEMRELAIADAAMAAETAGQGSLPGFIKRVLGDILEPKVRWEDNLHTTMTRAAGEPGHDWGRVDKRMITRKPAVSFARRVAKGCGTLVVGPDTSGSTVMALDRFFAEMSAIAGALQPRELYVMWCDTQVHRVDMIEDPQDLKDLHQRINADGGPGGGGGSDMRPIFKKIEEMGLQPDMLVVLTDMYVAFPTQAPPYETIWCSTTANKTGPFGKTIHVEL